MHLSQNHLFRVTDVEYNDHRIYVDIMTIDLHSVIWPLATMCI